MAKEATSPMGLNLRNYDQIEIISPNTKYTTEYILSKYLYDVNHVRVKDSKVSHVLVLGDPFPVHGLPDSRSTGFCAANGQSWTRNPMEKTGRNESQRL